MKRKLITFTILFSLLFGSANIYAATVLDSNLVDAIKSGLLTIKNYYYTLTDQNTQAVNQEYTKAVGNIIDSKAQEVITDIDQHQKNEIERADRELEQYMGQLEKDLDSQIDPEVDSIKKGITEKVNQNIVKSKQDILKEFEKQLSAKLKK